ncbi:ATP-binding protein [Pedobacter endophyticus]|uniref:histidine kinase n=1 Tax=Pedobacter endophyticus TaxID=2789740 RepID=A0A7U3SPR5_9SPHI|nr:ATP-binding protein [Pedobacter endophyticus]QPH38913.1 response regulator [Pedobacter endophyticus]
MENTNQINKVNHLLHDGGEMGELIRSMDWSNSPLGPIEKWPQSLLTSLNLCLSSTFPILIAWGPETIQFYNDAYRPICGAKHPASMGMNFRVCWETALPVVGDAFSKTENGEGTYIKDQQMFLDRYGYLEESFMTFSFAPIRDEAGKVGGIFHPITETTDKMLSARRTQILRNLSAATGKSKTLSDILFHASEQYHDYQFDLPFLAIYKLNGDHASASLLSLTGMSDEPLFPSEIALDEPGQFWSLLTITNSNGPVVIDQMPFKNINDQIGPFPEPPMKAVAQSIHVSGQKEAFGIMICGVSSRRALDEDYLSFFDLLKGTFNTAVSNVYAYEQEQKRAEALAAIDRSKTAFFSNVSHEFRTPLTLMLGPLEELLENSDLSEKAIAHAEAAHRNSLRLLKLVNNLLDFSRVEAGRLQGSYQRTDIASVTVDLASSFRSIIEKSGMILEVNARPIDGEIYVDRQMWEKIVLNLLSNAYKYTLKGSIQVNLSESDRQIILTVSDTGIGIANDEIPHMFERFHRIENAGGRTHEGSGIGLSLVKELVLLHGGEISVESQLGAGSNFSVSIPKGKAHLPPSQILEKASPNGTPSLRGAFIKEALSLLDEHHDSETISVPQTMETSRSILVVDDNRDMRNYLSGLFGSTHRVRQASNGQQALELIADEMPDLVLSDMMMPVMDGKELLRQLRLNPATHRLPFIFLSARAGEEARIEGLELGANDYLVKPFAAAELITKVRGQLRQHASNLHAEQQLKNLFLQAPVAIAIFRGPSHILEMANDMMLGYWKRSYEEIILKPFGEDLADIMQEGFPRIMDEVYRNGKGYISPELAIKTDSVEPEEPCYLRVALEALRGEDDKIYGIMAIATDLSEQVNSRKRIEHTEERLRLAIDSAEMGTWDLNLNRSELHTSSRTNELFGLEEDELTLDRKMLLVIDEDRQRVSEAMSVALRNHSDGHYEQEYGIRKANTGELRYLKATGKTTFDEKGEASRFSGTIIDVTEGRADQERRNDFIAMASHELRTPLTSISAYLQLGKHMTSGEGNERLQSIIDKASQQASKMARLVTDLLDMSKLEAGKLKLDIQSLEISEMVKSSIEDLRPILGRNEIVFDAGIQARVSADKEKLEQVMSNLLSNAIKYSPDGGKILVYIIPLEKKVRVCIKDEGIGISQNDIEKLFQRYFRSESLDRSISGFGIGLYLCQEIITRHGGEIGVESMPGLGSTFYFDLPVLDAF